MVGFARRFRPMYAGAKGTCEVVETARGLRETVDPAFVAGIEA